MNFQELKSLFFTSVKWSQKQLVNGMLIEYDGDAIAKSSIIYQVSPDGLKSPLPDGEYKTKEGVLFILKDGKVSSVESPSTVAQPSSEPVKQAQSSQEENSQSQINDTIMSDKNKTEQVKASDEEMAKQPVTTSPDAEDAEDTQETASYQKILADALAPITAALKEIQASLGTTSTMAEETKEKLSKIAPVVEKLAKEPAEEKKETKKPLNPFNSKKEFEDDVTTSKTYGVLKAGAQTKK